MSPSSPNTQGKLIIFSAPSGSGKSTIVNALLKMGFDMQFSISATSRKPRGQETHGCEYYFLSPDNFRSEVEKENFLEWEEVYTDTYYGTLKSEVNRITDTGSHIVFDVDVVGGVNIKKQYPEKAISIFIQPPSIQELRNRLIQRNTDSLDKIEERLAKAEFELSFADQFDHVVVNEKLDEAIKETALIIEEFTKKP